MMLAVALQVLLLVIGAASAGRRRQRRRRAPAAPPAVEAAPVDARVSAEQIELTFVATGTGSGYKDQLVRFVIYTFDKQPGFLTDAARAQMAMYNAEDRANFQRQPTPGGDKRPALRAYIKRSIDCIEPARDGQPHNSPFKIEGEGALTYVAIRNYMATKANIVEVHRDAAVKYLREIGKGDNIPESMQVGEGLVRLEIYQSTSQFSAIRSAVGYVYKSARVPMPEEMANELGIFIAGIKRNVASAKNHLGLKISEGKEAMSEEAFEMLAKTLFQSKDKRDIFNHLFLVLDWNLMKRAENCVNAKINHIRFEEDCLVFEFAKSKNDQNGEVHGPWHCYANPEKPHICIQLAMARYLFCFPDALQGDVPLFEGTNQYKRYSSRMLKLYSEKEAELSAMGLEPHSLGTHSARKGVGTMVAAGCTVGPPIVSLCLRAGWTLGGVKDKYLFRANAGDRYVGRCASGLDVNAKEFAISPAYFDYSHLDASERVEMQQKVEGHLLSRLPGVSPEGSDVQKKTWKLAKACFAAICYHYETLEADLHNKCPLRTAAVFRDIPDEIRSLATTKFPWTKTADTPRFTGIPPHVQQLVKLEELERSLASAKDDIVNGVKAEMDKRGFSSTGFNTSEITEAISGMTEKIVKELLEQTDICKKAAVAAAGEATEQNQVERAGLVMHNEDEEWCSAQLRVEDVDINEDGEEEEAETATVAAERRELARKRRRKNETDQLNSRKLTVGVHHGRMNVLPQQWTFSSMTSLQLVQNWFIGDMRRNIPPLCNLDSKNVIHLKGGNRTRNKMKSFMRIVEEEAREKDVWIADPSKWDYRAATKMWEAIKPDFSRKYCQTKRKRELAWSSVYANMSAANAFENSRNKKSQSQSVDFNARTSTLGEIHPYSGS